MKLCRLPRRNKSGSVCREHSARTVAVMRTVLRSFTLQHLKHVRLHRIRYADTKTRRS